MCGLAHDLERHGLPTIAIGLIGRHVSLIRPPRALVVPFELGRPFGAPEEPDFQRRVLADALRLLERTDGPVLETFPDAPPEARSELGPWSPPIARAPPMEDPASQAALAAALRAEIAALRPSCERWIRRGGRRLDRITGMEPDAIVELIQAYARDPSIESPMPGVPPELVVKFAADDLKHAYYQAALARPARVTDIEVDNWFFGETVAGGLLFTLRQAMLGTDDQALRDFASHAFVPSHQVHRA